jgi:hypothetical protein
MVTYGALGMKKDWKAFTRSLPHPVTFLHRDEFEKLYPSSDFKFPAVIVDNSGYLKVVINNSDFDTIHSLEELKTKLTAVI